MLFPSISVVANNPPLISQLLCFAWFPATSSRPKTVATFRMLKQFHMISLESKMSVYEYYNSLAKLVDNTGLIEVKVIR